MHPAGVDEASVPRSTTTDVTPGRSIAPVITSRRRGAVASSRLQQIVGTRVPETKVDIADQSWSTGTVRLKRGYGGPVPSLGFRTGDIATISGQGRHAGTGPISAGGWP